MAFITSILVSLAFAQGWDASVGLQGRTRPVAAQFEATGGYGYLARGKIDDPMYSYLRPYLTVRGPSTLTTEAGVDIYPLSFLGVTIGRQYMRRLVEQPEMDCETLECKGWLNQTFIRARAVGQYKAVFGSLSYERSDYDETDSTVRPVFQSNNAVIQPAKGDRGNDWILSVGYELNKTWSAGMNFEVFRTEVSKNEQTQQIAFVRWRKNDRWECLGGAGRFYSSPIGTAAQVAGYCTWFIQKKIGY